MGRNWYEIKAKADFADVYIYDEIGGWGIQPSDLVRDLQGLKGKTLNVYVNSPGGDAHAAIALYNAFSRHNGPVNMTVDGMAASAASVIVQAGSKRLMGKSAALMIHDAWGMAVGPASEMEKFAGELNALSNDIADIYAEKAGGTAEEWRQKMADETWYRSQEAVDAGLADEMAASAQNAYSGRVFNLSKFNKVPEWVNQDTNDPPSDPPDPAVQDEEEDDEMSDLNDIRRALGIDENDGDIQAAITGLQGQIVTLTATLNADAPEKGVAAQLRRELSEAEKKVIALETEKDKKFVELGEKLRVAEAKHRVEAAIQAGRVTPAQREMVTKIALRETEEDFNKFLRGLPSVDYSERGGSSADAFSEVEPTELQIAIAKQAGTWDASKPQESRMRIMRQNARDKGIILPTTEAK